jgi:hypothetical protein
MVLKYYIDFVVQKYIKEVFKFQKVYRLYKAYPLFPLHQFYSYLYVISKQTLLLYEWLLFTFLYLIMMTSRGIVVGQFLLWF